MDLQRSRFDQIIDYADALFSNLIYHISNSAGIFNDRRNHYGMVRPGITLYGVSPYGRFHEQLKPVMHFRAPVVLKKRVLKGESIGYNQTFVAEKDLEIAVIQAGYGDGVPVQLSNYGTVFWNGKKFPIIGKVSMDLVTIDCSDTSLKDGDEVTIWGAMEHRIESQCGDQNKSPYSFLTGVTQRVKRKYIFV